MADSGGDEEKQKQDFAKRLLVALKEGTFVGNPNADDDINNFAKTIKNCLDNVREILDERGLKFSEEYTKAVEQLIEALKNVMSLRQAARVGAFSGNVLRIGGTLKYAHPFGAAAFWIGLTMTSIGDLFATNKTRDIEKLAAEIQSIFDNNRTAFADVSRAILRLERSIEQFTGWTLYDEEFRDFLRISTEDPNAVKEDIIPIAQENPQLRRNVMDLAQNRAVLDLLRKVMEAIETEDIAVLHVVSQAFGAISFIQNTPEESAAFQVGEVAVRGLVLLLEYKQNKNTLKNFLREVQRMKKQYQCLHKIYGTDDI